MKKIIVLVAAALTVTSAAIAAPSMLRAAFAISGQSPLEEDCGMVSSIDPTGGDIDAASPNMHSETEPHIAVNPTDRDNIVAAWIQDRNRGGGGGRSNVVATTFDGGETWQTVLVPGISDCTGGRWSRATDPWLDFGPDGVVYLASLTFESTDPSAMLVSTSRDGGLNWEEPRSVTTPAAVSDGIEQTDVFQDKPQLTAHPRIPGRVYMTWMQRIPYGVDTVNFTMLSVSSDHGRTWSLPMRIFASGAFTLPHAGELLILPNDSLLYVTTFFNLSDGVIPEDGPRIPSVIAVRRSIDDGATWSPPQVLAERQRVYPRDPEPSDPAPDDGFGAALIAGGFFAEVGLGSDGTIYAVWSDYDSPDGGVVFTKSTDHGLTWSQPRSVVAHGAQPFLASVAVGHRGTVGVTYLDLRADQLGDDELTAQAWFAHSPDGGETWTEERLLDPFDLRSAPFAGGLFLGDYAGLDAAAAPDANGLETFAAAIPVSPPLSSGPCPPVPDDPHERPRCSDIWFASMQVLPPSGGRNSGAPGLVRAI